MGNVHATEETETSNNGGTFVWNIGSWTLGVPTVSNKAYIFAGSVTVYGTVSTGRVRFTGGTLK